MGNNISYNLINPSHIEIYKDILKLKNPQTRVQMIETLLSGQEYLSTAKHTGIYSSLLSYITAVRRGVQELPFLPGEGGYIRQQSHSRNDTNIYMQQQQQQQQQIISRDQPQRTAWQQVAKKPKEKAISYFNSCLEVLNLSESQALTEESLKAAYKKAAVRAHPDKGGSEEQFEAITRAYAYLSDILKRIGGKRVSDEVKTVESARELRETQDDKWKHVEPVKLNPKNLNMEMFNRMYEQTKLPDPEEEGYGDWLKEEGKTEEAAKFSGKFNRDVFNSMFDTQASKKASANQQQQQNLVLHPNAMALTLAPTMGVGLGRERPADYTAPVNSQLKYTDLRAAYTTETTISDKVANVRVENRDMKKYKADREKAPQMSEYEKQLLAEQEKEFERREAERQIRAAQEAARQNEHFKRMKQFVLTG